MAESWKIGRALSKCPLTIQITKRVRQIEASFLEWSKNRPGYAFVSTRCYFHLTYHFTSTTHCHQNKMADIFQAKLSITVSWQRFVVIGSKFPWICHFKDAVDSKSSLVIMVCTERAISLTTPSQYLYQCWLISSEVNFRAVSQENLKIFIFVMNLTHWGRVTHICVGNLNIIGSAASHYLHQCWNIVNWTPRNKLRWNVNQNSYIFIHEIHLEMSSGKWRPFCLGLNVLKITDLILQPYFPRASELIILQIKM